MSVELGPLLVNGTEHAGLKQGKILVGTAIRWELENPRFVADQIYTHLLGESENMEVTSISDLLAGMREGSTVVKIGNKNELLGFARLSEDDHDPRRIVVGSWLGIRHPDYKNGSGAEVMKHAAELAFNSIKFPNAREVIARIKADNDGPQTVLRRLGAELETIAPIRSPKTGNIVHVYNLTMVGLGRV